MSNTDKKTLKKFGRYRNFSQFSLRKNISNSKQQFFIFKCDTE